MHLRRTVLGKMGVSVVALVSGCLDVDANNMAYISINNYTSKPVSGELTVSQDGTIQFSEGFELAEGEGETPTGERYDDVVENGGAYTIEVTLDSGRSASHEWNVPEELGQSVQISIRAENIEFKDLASASD